MNVHRMLTFVCREPATILTVLMNVSVSQATPSNQSLETLPVQVSTCIYHSLLPKCHAGKRFRLVYTQEPLSA